MDWLDAIPAALAAVAILFIPGLAVTLALRLRAFDAVALAPLVSMSLISVGAIAASLAGISWSVLVPAAAAVPAVILALAVSRLLRTPAPGSPGRPSRRPRSEALYFAGAAVAFILIALQVIRVLGSPEAFSQSFDNIFHLNALHYIQETGDASSLTVASMTAGDGPVPFYPAGWHGLVSLVIQASGAPLTVGVNATNIIIAGAVWPLSVLFAVRQLVRLVPAAVLGGGVLAAAFPAFPILLLDFGVLYPNFLSLAMVPAGLAVAAVVFGQAPQAGFDVRRGLLLGLLAYPGIALAHPNGIMTLLLLAVPLLIGAFILHLRALRARRAKVLPYVLASVAVALILSVFAVLWNVIRPPAEAAAWGRVQTSAQAFGEAVLNAPFERPVALTASVLALFGVAACLRNRRLWWLPASYLIAIGGFVVASGFERSDLRSFITGVWYNDPYRLAAVLPLLAAPLAVIGLSSVMAWVLHRAAAPADAPAKQPRSRNAVLPVVAGALAVLVLVPLTQGRNMDDAVSRAANMYAVTDDSALVDTDELELIERLSDVVPEDATIAVNPYTGAALAFALGDRETTHKHTLDTVSAETITLEKYLRDADTRPEVCPAVQEENLEYVLDFGRQEVHGGDHRYPGLENLDSSENFELVDEVGDARLFKFVGCGLE